MEKTFLKAERCLCGWVDRYDESQYGSRRYERMCPNCKRLVMYREPGKDYVKQFLDASGVVGTPIEDKPSAEQTEKELGVVPSLQLYEHFFSYAFPAFTAEASGTEYRFYDVGVSGSPMEQLKERRLDGNRFLIGRVCGNDGDEADICWDEDGAQMCLMTGGKTLHRQTGFRAFYNAMLKCKEK